MPIKEVTGSPHPALHRDVVCPLQSGAWAPEKSAGFFPAKRLQNTNRQSISPFRR